MDNADLLWDYFSIEIVTQNLGQNEPERGPFLNSLPCVIDGYVPQLEALPQLLYNLSRVDYTNVSMFVFCHSHRLPISQFVFLK